MEVKLVDEHAHARDESGLLRIIGAELVKLCMYAFHMS